MKKYITFLVTLFLAYNAQAQIWDSPGWVPMAGYADTARKADTSNVAKKIAPQTAVVSDSFHAAAGRNTYFGNAAAPCTTIILGTTYADSNTVFRHTVTATDSVKAGTVVRAAVKTTAPIAEGTDSVITPKLTSPAGTNLSIGSYGYEAHGCSSIVTQDTTWTFGGPGLRWRDAYIWRWFLTDSLNIRPKNDSTYFIYKGNTKKDSSNTW